MRELILKMSMSMDGFVSDLEGVNRWMFGGDPAARDWAVETTWNASLHIMGSRTFQAMAGYWPTSTDVFAAPMNQIPKAVFSRQGPAILKDAGAASGGGDPQPGAESWAEAHVADGDLAAEIAKLKAQDGKPILAHGGVAFTQSLVAAGLVDELALGVHPIALGQGFSLFSDLSSPMPLRLVGSKAFPGGAVAQVYRPV